MLLGALAVSCVFITPTQAIYLLDCLLLWAL
jgi:hypothetical protein